MNVELLLTCYFYTAMGLCGFGLLDRFVRLIMVGLPRHTRAAIELVDAPSPPSFGTIAKRLLLGPALHFHYKANRIWTLGCTLYHLAILLTVTGYVVATGILLSKIAGGVAIPDFHRPMPGGNSLAISNLLAFIFGNAEKFPSQFLFGSWAAFFQAIAWFDLPLAVMGNGCLLYTVLRRQVGSIRHRLDDAMIEKQLRGQFSGQRLFVRLMIFSIILAEFIGRMGWMPNIAYYHAVLALSLIAALPFTYLVHIPLSPLAAWLAIWRRRRNAIA
ncbi:hypothetical protein SAMN04489760_10562 [Syntrophus gentianae]|uniref:Uncharacterized protein n=1 Tax=Syntrophus gentianae TaxID=43775 RepID=A0A1H7W094_9BACT|nr:hypothetical protein [Syntrophus gentianae]SEM14539.1 hypothetical protein SAMN04489760_10562 [Syntrophus gentianae]